jgi:SAM-dependent methyltransferase
LSRLTSRDRLLGEQYQDASNLNARILLHQRFSTNKYGWTRWVFDHFQFPPTGRILEIGCGPGNLWRENRQRLPEGWRVMLSDLSPGMLRQVRHHLGINDEQFDFQRIDAEAIPYPSGTFDGVIANHMLYHVPDRGRALAEMHRVLRPGGRLYAATNGRDHHREMRALVQLVDPVPRHENAAAFFGLENGREQLAVHFGRVDLHLYPDGLVVTEVEPLVAYILSHRRPEEISRDRAVLAGEIEQIIQAEGAVRITKSTGMFEAVKGA